jgi:serine/threonine-protein kinase
VKIENYTIKKEISRGPITTVYLATQKSLDRNVLLKVLNVQWKKEKDLVERFKREAKIYARLKHPNIVNIYNFGASDDSLFLAMEYVEGFDLAQFIGSFHPLPLIIQLFITKEILKGLQYAHSNGIIHRDIKPSNIIIGVDGSVKISDFGLAIMSDVSSITEHGVTVGTPAYMSPEQTKSGKINQSSDIFSLGIAIYEMASGKNPFEGENYASSIQNILDSKPASLRKVKEDTPAWYSDLTDRMLEKNPVRRPKSINEILSLMHSKSLLFEEDVLKSFIKNPVKEYSITDIKEPKNPTNVRRNMGLAALVLIVILGFLLYEIFQPPKTGLQITRNKSALAFSDTMEENDWSESSLIPEEENSPQNNSLNPKIIKEPNRKRNQPVVSVHLDEKKDEERLLTRDSSGGIFVVAFPWATITIDGKYYETTPMQTPIALGTGSYSLEITNPNFEPYQESIEIESGRVDTLNVNLKPLIGYLQIQVNPWAEIHINGKYVETTPVEKPLSLSAGKYELKLINPNTQTWTDSITISAGQTIFKQVTLKSNQL